MLTELLIWFFGEERYIQWLIRMIEKYGQRSNADEVRLAYFQRYGRWPGTANVNPSEGSANAGGNK